jgi:hypothetical protein
MYAEVPYYAKFSWNFIKNIPISRYHYTSLLKEGERVVPQFKGKDK